MDAQPAGGEQEVAELIQALTSSQAPDYNKPAVTLRRYADNHGLASTEVSALLAAICQSRHTELAQRVVRLLVPRSPVASSDAEEIAHGFSTIRTPELRGALVRWLVIMLDSKQLSPGAFHVLRRAYAVLFHYIGFDSSKRELCRLLYALTRRPDVTPFRCRELSRVLSRDANNIDLVALAELYASYAPNWVTFPARDGGVAGLSGIGPISRAKLHKRFFRTPDPEWHQSVLNAAKGSMRMATATTSASVDADDNDDIVDFQLREQRKSKRGRLDDAITSSSSSSSSSKVTLREVSTARELATALVMGKLALPADFSALSIINDSASQWGVLVMPETASSPLVASAISTLSAHDDNVVRALVAMAERLQHLPIAAHGLFFELLATWDGTKDTSGMLTLLAYLSPVAHDSLARNVLWPLHQIICTVDVKTQAQIVESLGRMAYHWTALPISAESEDVNPTASLAALKAFVDDVLLTILAYSTPFTASLTSTFEMDDPLLQIAAIRFYSSLERACRRRVIPVEDFVPPAALAMRLLLSASSFVGIVGMAELLTRLVPTFRAESALQELPNRATELRTNAKQFGDLVASYPRVLVLDRPFHDTFLEPVIVSSENLLEMLRERVGNTESALDVMRHPAFRGFVERFLLERPDAAEQRNSPVLAQRQLGMAMFLRWLDDQNIRGIGDIVGLSVKTGALGALRPDLHMQQ